MKKSKFVKSTIILLVGGFITKLLGMTIKIITTRLLDTEAIGIYMLIMPTYMILITLAQLGFPVAISKIVAEQKKRSKNLIFGILPISMAINLLIIIFLIFTSGFIANNLLHESRTHYAILGIGLVLPFISISSILRGYFFGKERMFPHVISNIAEDIIRLIIVIVGIPIFLTRGLEFTICFLVLTNIISELVSIIILLLFIPKNVNISKADFKPHKQDIKEIFSISLPTTGSRLIGNIGYFLEPIILTFCLLKSGYSNSFIVSEYGIVTGYVMPLLLLPSFFTLAVSQALIPAVSNSYSNGHFKYAKGKIKQAIIFSLLIGIPVTILFMLFPELFLKLIYNTTEGVIYLKILAPIFLLYYIQTPLSASLQAIGKANTAMSGTLRGMIFRTLFLFILSMLKIGLWGLVVAVSFNIIYVTIYYIKKINVLFKTLN